MEKKTYRKPFLAIEQFTPNEYISACEPETKNEVIYNETSCYYSLFWDINFNLHYDTGEYFSFDSIPSPLYIDITASTIQGYYRDGFVNQPSRPGGTMKFYRNNKYSTKTELKTVYIVRDENGNDYYFSSAPTLRTVEIKNHS